LDHVTLLYIRKECTEVYLAGIAEIFFPKQQDVPPTHLTDVSGWICWSNIKISFSSLYLPMGCVHVLISSCCESDKERHSHEMTG